jgi:hypothetical protein
MKLLKGIAIGLLSILLLQSLAILGLVLTLNATVLNADFVTSQLDKLDISSLVDEASIRQVVEDIPIIQEMPEETKEPEIEALVERTKSALAKFEPQFKEELSTAIHTTYDYLLGKSPNLDLTDTLYDTALNTNLITSLVKEIDIYFLVEYFVIQEVTEEVTEGISDDLAFLAVYVDDAVIELEPWIREQVDGIIAPVTDYILGKSQSLDIVISIEALKESEDGEEHRSPLGKALWEVVRESPPERADLDLPPDMADIELTELVLYNAFVMFYGDLVGLIPSTFEINEDLLGPEIATQITEALAEANEALENEEIRDILGIPSGLFNIAIIILLLSLVGIIIINRQVSGISRILGITFLASGVFELITISIAKNQVQKLIATADMPSSIHVWLEQLVGSAPASLQTFSIVLIVVGTALLAVSFIYRRNQSQE